jgi:hypothetical protein
MLQATLSVSMRACTPHLIDGDILCGTSPSKPKVILNQKLLSRIVLNLGLTIADAFPDRKGEKVLLKFAIYCALL